MSHSKYLDSLKKEEKEALKNQLWEQQNHKCFICQKEIDLVIQSTNIDHIKPLTNGGKDDCLNFAITHEHCNKTKQDADLNIARKIFCLNEIMSEAELKKERPSLKHVLAANGGSVYGLKYRIKDGKFLYSFDAIGDVTVHESEIFEDKLSGEKTVFIQAPLSYLYHDDKINPRGINSSITLLIKEFDKKHPQLHLSLARLDGDRIKIFDGQHKAVAQIMLGVTQLPIRLFIAPDVDRLTATNVNAGSKLKQIAFDKAIVRQLHDSLYTERLRKYQVDHSLQEDDFSFSEQNVIDHFKGEKKNIKAYIINSQKNAIVSDSNNRLRSYINFEGRGFSLPLSYSTFEKTVLSTFVNSNTILTTPINYKTDEGLNPRILEKEQIIQLCNIIASELLIDRYDTEIGSHKLENTITEGRGDLIPDRHLVAYRLLREEIMMNWVKFLDLVINNYFCNVGDSYNRDNLFQQKFPDKLWANMKNFLVNLRELPLWKDRSLSSTVFGGKNTYAYWNTVFTTGCSTDGSHILAEPLNVVKMIREYE